MPLFPEREQTGVWWRDHSLTLVLTAMLVGQTLLAVWAGAYTFVREQPFGKVPVWSDSFWVWWVHEYNMSLVADTFGVWLVVVLTIRFRERSSKEG